MGLPFESVDLRYDPSPSEKWRDIRLAGRFIQDETRSCISSPVQAATICGVAPGTHWGDSDLDHRIGETSCWSLAKKPPMLTR